MKSAFYCFQRAAKCEQMAEEATDETDRNALLMQATRWLALGNEAMAKEANERKGRVITARHG